MTASTPSTSRFIDLSHELYDGMAPYPGLPLPRIAAHQDHATSRPNYEGEEFFLGKLDMPANVGTYIDAPFHRFRDRADLSQIPLSKLVGLPGVVVDCTGAPGVDFWNADDTTTRRRPIHTRLLGAGVLIVEHLCRLGDLPPSGFRFSAPVVRIRQGASFPVRAFAEVPI